MDTKAQAERLRKEKEVWGVLGGPAMMLSLPTSVRIWLATRATDLRKSFDSLAEVVRQQLEGDPLSGQLFVFRNKRGDRVKLLYWDEDGFVIVYKRLEVGTFRFPSADAGPAPTKGLLR